MDAARRNLAIWEKSPWKITDVPEMKAWARRTLSPDPSAEPGVSEAAGEGMSAKSKAQTIVAIKRARKIDVETNILEGKFHNAELCQQRRLRQIEDVKRRLLPIPDSLPFPKEDRELVRGKIAAALRGLAAS